MNGDLDTPTYLSVCSGIGGLDLALERVTGARAVGYCERESYAQAVLMDRMEKEALVAAPLWDDLRAISGGCFRGVVDWLIGGIPCQPHSHAGKQRRAEDDRDLIDAFCELAGEMEPRFVFVENVRGFVCGGGIGRLLGQMADFGLDAEWCCLRASDIRAPHQRQRVFVLAYSEHARLSLRSKAHNKHGRNAPGYNADGRDASMAWPPGPDGDWRGIPEHLWPSLESGVRGMADGLSRLVEPAMRYRTDRLRCLGNAVVPQQAELALRILLDRISSDG